MDEIFNIIDSKKARNVLSRNGITNRQMMVYSIKILFMTMYFDYNVSNVIKELKKDVKEADLIYLASDPDREGEAIAWHLKDALGIKDNKYKRVLFHEITKDKVIQAINNPTVIDDNLVQKQEEYLIVLLDLDYLSYFKARLVRRVLVVYKVLL